MFYPVLADVVCAKLTNTIIFYKNITASFFEFFVYIQGFYLNSHVENVIPAFNLS